MDAPRLDEKEGLRQILELTREYAVRLVVIDALPGGHRMDENSAEIREILVNLQNLARDENCAVLVVHHLRKGKATDSADIMEMLRGSSIIGYYARSIIGVFGRSDHRAVEVVESNICMRPPRLGMRIKGDGMEFNAHAPVPEKTQSDAAEEFLRNFLAEGSKPRRTVIAAGEKLGLSRATVERVAGKAGMKSRKGWHLPGSEPQQAEAEA